MGQTTVRRPARIHQELGSPRIHPWISPESWIQDIRPDHGSRITDHLGSPGGYFRVVDPGYSQGSRITDILERSIQYPPDGSPPIHRRLSTNGESRVSTEITRHLGSTGGYPRLVPDHGPECDRQADIVATQRSTHSRLGVEI